MKWVKRDYKGNEQIWYSSDFVEQIKQTLKEIKETIKSIEKDAINGLSHSASFSKNSEFSSIQNKANGCIKMISEV